MVYYTECPNCNAPSAWEDKSEWKEYDPPQTCGTDDCRVVEYYPPEHPAL